MLPLVSSDDFLDNHFDATQITMHRCFTPMNCFIYDENWIHVEAL